FIKTMVDDKRLIKQAKAGDRKALGDLSDLHQPAIYRYLVYRVRDAALAEDITAEVFVTMVRKLHTFEDRGRPFLAWLYTIAGNAIRMHFRKQKVEFSPFSEEMIDQNAAPDQIADKRLTHERLLAFIPHLTEEQSQVIFMKFMDGFSNREIAKVLGKTEGSIKALQHRALATLRNLLTQEVNIESA
ncbi:MAG: sigma-70 family RNA polymerase sigma factor, partial [Chloroflexota bacterium]